MYYGKIYISATLGCAFLVPISLEWACIGVLCSKTFKLSDEGRSPNAFISEYNLNDFYHRAYIIYNV